jgi:hypothetical protein
MLRHPGCIEGDLPPEALPRSPYNTTAALIHGLRRRAGRLAAAIARGRLAAAGAAPPPWAAPPPPPPSGSSSHTLAGDEGEDAATALRDEVHRAQASMLDTQMVSAVLEGATRPVATGAAAGGAASAAGAAPPVPLLAIIYMTKRPGGYDVLLSSLARQTDFRYELVCVDELLGRHREVVVSHLWIFCALF